MGRVQGFERQSHGTGWVDDFIFFSRANAHCVRVRARARVAAVVGPGVSDRRPQIWRSATGSPAWSQSSNRMRAAP